MKTLTIYEVSNLKKGSKVLNAELYYYSYYKIQVGAILTLVSFLDENNILFNTGNNINVIINLSQIRTGAVKLTNTFKAMKFRVKDVEHSKKIQEYLFSIGYEWSSGICINTDDNIRFIYAELNGILLHGYSEQIFENSLKNEETELVETVSYSLKVVDTEALRKHTQKEEIKKSIHEVEKQLSELREKLKSLEM